MNILFNDVLQNSDAPKELISSSLSEYYDIPSNEWFTIILKENKAINCIGVANLGYGTDLSIRMIDNNNNQTEISIYINDNEKILHVFSEVPNIKTLKLFAFEGLRIGRLATGKAINIKTSIPKEPTLVSTNKPRVTLSGQVIDGLGGYNYWRVSLDTRYKIDKDKLDEIIKGYSTLSKGLPMFVSFEDEKGRLPFKCLYVNDTNQQELSFESSINKPLFSRRFIFEERF